MVHATLSVFFPWCLIRTFLWFWTRETIVKIQAHNQWKQLNRVPLPNPHWMLNKIDICVLSTVSIQCHSHSKFIIESLVFNGCGMIFLSFFSCSFCINRAFQYHHQFVANNAKIFFSFFFFLFVAQFSFVHSVNNNQNPPVFLFIFFHIPFSNEQMSKFFKFLFFFTYHQPA